jgi:hypothetical protein
VNKRSRKQRDKASGSRRACEAEPSRHHHEIGGRVGLHLLHDLATVRLNRDLADAEFAPDLVLEQTAGVHQIYDLFFSMRQ